MKAIYVIRAENGVCKIGSSMDPRKRFASLRLMSPLKLELLSVFQDKDAVFIEAFLHEHFASKRAHGEWFALSEEEIKAVPELIKGKDVATTEGVPTRGLSKRDVKRIRVKLKLTVKDLAALLDVTANAVYRWECGWSPCTGIYAKIIRTMDKTGKVPELVA